MNEHLLNYVVRNLDHISLVKDLTLIRGYHQIFEQNPGLHPDGFDDIESGWPHDIKVICAEMWRRVSDQNSNVNLEHMYYINKSFRKLAAESRRRGRRSH